MEIHEALDHARSYVTRWCKPLERLEEVLAAALEAESVVRTTTRTLATLTEQITGAERHITELQKIEVELGPRVDAMIAATNARVAELGHHRGVAETAHTARIAEMRTQAEATRRELDEEAQTRQARLMKELAETQAKLERAKTAYAAFIKRLPKEETA